MPELMEAARETRTMRLLSRALRGHGPLSTFLATRRCPGKHWETWESIGYDMRNLTGEDLSREGLHKMAVRYGIPDTTRDDDLDTYRATIKALGITI